MAKLRPILIIMLLCLTLVMSGYGMDIGLGAATQWASHNYDALLILPQSYPPRQNLAILIETNHDNFAFQIGRVMGSTAAMLQGITEIVDGIQRVQVGVLVSAETEVKRQIKKESEMFMRKIDTKNPDIGIDNDTGYIVLKHPDNGQTIATDLLFKWYKQEGE